MADAQEIQLHLMNREPKEGSSLQEVEKMRKQTTMVVPASQWRNYKWWVRLVSYTLCILSGQTTALLLGRLYFVKGGSSKWIATLVQLAGFPVLIPYYFITLLQNPKPDVVQEKLPPISTLASVYITLGLLVATSCYFYSVGLAYLPVSTYTLICASQLAFNSLFSYFFNSQKFTPFIINSLVLLTVSSILLVFNNESQNPTGISAMKYAIGFASTIIASAGFALVLSLTQLCFRKVLKTESFRTVMDLIIFQQLVATCAAIVGVFASGEWSRLAREMGQYQLGKLSYLMNLAWTAVSWQVFSIGCVGLIFEVSSLFSNAIGVLGLPIVPVFAVFIFGDKMDGIKAISMFLAVWGFVSYVYQHYLVHLHRERQDGSSISKIIAC